MMIHRPVHAQFRGTLDLQSSYSNNVEGSNSSSPDNILQPMLELLYGVPIDNTTLTLRGRYQPQYFFREVKRSFHYGYLSLRSVTSFPKNGNTSSEHTGGVHTDTNTAHISRLLLAQVNALKRELAEADYSSIAPTLLTLDELLTLEGYTDTYKEILLEELEVIRRSASIPANSDARRSIDTLISHVSRIEASEDILYLGGTRVSSNTTDESSVPAWSPAMLILPDDIAYTGISHFHLYLWDDISPLSPPRNDAQLSVSLSGDLQDNTPKYNSYSSKSYSLESGYTTNISSALVGIQYAYQNVFYPNDTLFRYYEHRIYGDLRLPISKDVVWISSLGYGQRTYPHPLRIQPIPRRIVTSQSEFSQFSLGSGVFVLPASTLTAGILAKMTINTDIDSMALSFNTSQVASYAGTTIYNTYAYDLLGVILTAQLRLPFDIDLGTTCDYEHRRYPNFRVPKLQGGGSDIQTRNDNVTLFTTTISRPLYEERERIASLFTSITPSVDITYTDHASSLADFSYQEFSFTCTLSFDF